MKRHKWKSVFGGLGILAFGVAGMLALAAMKKPPAEAKASGKERAIRVETISAAASSATVTLSGFGEVRSVRTVEIASEVSGTVIQTHPRLVAGTVVRAGELLFALDARTNEAALEQVNARIAESDMQLRRLEMERKNETDRLALLQRSEKLARDRFDRTKKLHAEAIGNQTDMDDAERLLNEAVDAVQLLEREVAMFPIRIQETQQQKSALEAARKQAQLSLDYATVRAPFDGRITDVRVEQGQYVSPGQSALMLADDSALEIAVKLDAAEARTWLRFAEQPNADGMAWFGNVEPVDCEVRWVEEVEGAAWRGTLDRVEQFDPESRTVAVVVRVSAADSRGDSNNRAPLVAGMFCEARIPGREISGVFRLPQGVLTLDRTVRVARAGRLTNVPVEVLRQEEGEMYVRAELAPDDRVITTRLVNPVENTLLELAATLE